MAFCTRCGQTLDAQGVCPNCGHIARPTEPGVTRVSDPPQAAPPFPGGDVPENTSGQGTNAVVPEEIKGWNWGAFLLNWIWGLGNRVYIALLCFVPFVNVVMPFVLGAKGSEWAWQQKRWAGVKEFKESQRRWAIAGVIVLAAGVLISVVAVGLILAFVGDVDTPAVTEEIAEPLPGDPGGTVLTAFDGDVSIQLPDGWFEAVELNDEADIQAVNADEDAFAIVLVESREDFAEDLTLEEYGDITRQTLTDSIEVSEQGEPEPVEINGNPGLITEIRGTSDGIAIIYLHTVVESTNSFVQVLTWSLPSAYEDNEADMIDITASLEAI